MILAGVAALALTAGGFLAIGAEEAGKAAVKGEEVAIGGTISCTYCTFAHAGKLCPEGCCLSCIKAGDPVLFTGADGTQYLLLAKQMHKPVITTKRSKLVGVPVRVKGVLARGKGVQVIFVEDITKAG